ncbi:hypothetical protein BU26DRAFT_190753 [Trematosphaeria pertusa]|uniref:NYN domain-containing protein n=1 Tax=Trematosphaeria pertusa TaxID=390896 RepID=A0A6A6HTQ3_9PLEO|nr:uncharacterized protein BU26DRAFT_190753 [Trematosphaeria pertusa]KAF2240800.1 hypothetical protein BU26DRAFT_190753 [Trematosphaeria pertusa]
MPSQPIDDPGWDFSSVLELIDSDLQHHVVSPTLRPASRALDHISKNKVPKDAEDNRSLHLGSFGKLFEELGLFNEEPLPPVSPAEPLSDDPSSSDDALLPPPVIEAEVETKDPKLAKEDVVDTNSIVKEVYDTVADDAYTGMTRKQRHLARKKAEKERKAQQQPEKQLAQREKVRKNLLRELIDSSVPDTPTPINGPALKQVQPHSRSNVGAKIRPTTPVELDDLINATEQRNSAKIPKVFGVTKPSKPPAALLHPTSSPLLNSSARPFTPGQSEHTLPLSQPVDVDAPSSALAKRIPNAAAQYTTFGTLAPVQHAYSVIQSSAHGYFTSQVPPSTVYGHSLIPRTVQPVILQRPAQPVVVPQPPVVPNTPVRIPGARITVRNQVDRNLRFLNQLIFDFPEERKWLVSPMQLCNEKTVTEGIHVFVDASNIMIGLRDALREHGVYQPFDLSFDSLALLMERRRPVAKRVFAGSHREAAPLPHVTRLFETSKAVGYENAVKEQVLIRREETEKKKFFRDVKKMGWQKAAQRRSGNDSGSDSETGQLAQTLAAPKWVEQGVDEILHLKMCQSIIDTEVPTTMVLATGDGAEAEHSDGFLAHVERALKRGWNVELVSWRQQTSGGYKNKKFRAKWGNRFKIIELDDYLESLIDTP